MPDLHDGAAGVNTLEQRIARELDWMRALSQFRTLDISGGIDLSSNDYLGLARDARLKEAAIESLARVSRVGSTGSRLLSGNAREWEDLEAEFAAFAGTEAALYFSSGYAANLGLLASLLRPGDFVFSDARNHASLIDAMRLSGATKVIYAHHDLPGLDQALQERAGRPGARLIVTESIFSMEGDMARLRDLRRIAKRHGAELVIDEAHATGVWGPEGRGIAAQEGVHRDVLAVVHTCGKALASAGAFICGGRALKDFLINRARTFIYTTAMPPYLAGQIRAAVQLARAADRERAHLRETAAQLREFLRTGGINCGASSTQIIPVILGSNEAALHAASELRSAGFAARAIRPPTVPPGSARLRISLTIQITQEQARRVAEVLRAACPRESTVSDGAWANGIVHA